MAEPASKEEKMGEPASKEEKMGKEVEPLLPEENKWPVARKGLSVAAAIAFAVCGTFTLASLVFFSLRSTSAMKIQSNVLGPVPLEQFFIVSELNGKVVTIKNGNASVGAKVIIKSKNLTNPTGQLWYLDKEGYIHSALNDLLITAKFNGTARMAPISKDPDSHWKFQNKLIVNEAGEVLDVRFHSKSEGASLTAFKYHGTANERWRTESFKQRPV